LIFKQENLLPKLLTLESSKQFCAKDSKNKANHKNQAFVANEMHIEG